MGGQEKYKVGSSRDYINKNYKEVVAKFESMGFTNIELVDLDDAGVLTGEVDTVKSVSIGGDDSFTDFDYFSKDEKVTIVYHWYYKVDNFRNVCYTCLGDRGKHNVHKLEL